MFKRTKLCTSLLVAFGGAFLSTAVQSQATAETQRVEITGSSIKRIAAEGALPVQVITAEQIKASGSTNVAEFIQRLPAMQGFQIADIAIGTNSGGIATANIHDIGSSYTLVLLNGRRIAPTGSGSTINLQGIPMSAIERIEVLTDGASALYGSDAIAGVVNFVLKNSHKGGQLNIQADKPLEGSGQSSNVSLTYGFGDLDKDRFSLVATYRHDQQAALKSGDRDFAASAYVPFTYNGTKYIYDRTSTFAIPANATVVFKKLPGETTTLPSYSFNPYQKSNGSCAPNNYYSLNNAVTATSVTENCAFDFVSTIDIYPESKRDSLFLAGQVKVSDSVRLFSDVAYTKFDLIARIAPNPVPISISTTSDLFTKYIVPNLSADQLAHVNTVSASYRASDFGTRDSQTITEAKHVVFGADADIGGWNVNSAFTWSQNSTDERYVGGYFKDKEFRALIASGALDPFSVAGQQSATTQSAINDSIFNGSIRTSQTTLAAADVRASGEIFRLPGGAVSLGLGADFRKLSFEQNPSDLAKAGAIYNYAAVPAYDLSRDSSGAFAELLVPVMKGLEVTGALRFDSIGAVKDGVNNKSVGSSESAVTYKLSGRFQPNKEWLFRGSYGTGFKAPAMLDIAQPLVASGVTASSYDCPFPGTDGCKPGKLQYSVLSGGNDQLKPEESTQATLGLRFEPVDYFGVGLDYWEVKIKDAVSGVSEKQAFADPVKYADLFTLYRTPAETQDYWAFKRVSTNIGKTINKGIDWDVTMRGQSELLGKVTFNLAGTHMLESSYTRPGTDNDFTDSMNRYGENQAVTFRNVFRGTIRSDINQWSHSLTFKYRNGYKDVSTTVRDVATNKLVSLSMDVSDYTTFDWQTTYRATSALELRLGINNLLNEAPPFTLRDSSGHQVGYDARYADPKLRTVYMAASYKF